MTSITLNDYIKNIKRMHWHIVKVSNQLRYVEMAAWREQNNCGEVIFLGSNGDQCTYLFEKEEDAVLFALRWG
jgi:hypothetical protein